jgi:cytoskeletal protein CcmA (bactofilin family)
MTTTLIARRTRVAGRIETHGDVVVEGRTEGSIVAAGCVTVGVAGVAVSDISAARAVVLGIVIGNISASERVDIAGSARVVGDVCCPTVSVAAPAAIEGRVDEVAPPLLPSSQQAPAVAPAPQPAVATAAQPPAGQPPRPTLRIRGAALVRPARPDSGSLETVPAAEMGRSNRATAEIPRVALPAVKRPSAPAPRSGEHAPVPPRPPGRARMLPRGHRGDGA